MRVLLMSVALMALAACSETTVNTEDSVAPIADPAAAPTTAAEATAQDTCGAAQYSALVGAPLAAASFPADSGIRIIQPDSAVTQDFRPDRINVIVDASGTITSIECY